MDFLHRCASAFTGERESAEDLVQETLLRAWTYFDTLEPGTHARSWLYRIMRNTFINDVRRSKRIPDHIEFDEEHHTASPASWAAPSGTDLNARIEEGTFEDVVMRAVESLPGKIRNVLLLRHVEDFQYHEIADALNIPVGTVRSRLNRARSVLFTRLKDYARSKGYAVGSDAMLGGLVLAS